MWTGVSRIRWCFTDGCNRGKFIDGRVLEIYLLHSVITNKGGGQNPRQ